MSFKTTSQTALLVCLNFFSLLRAQELELVSPEAAPQHGTFWSWQKQGNEPPLPFNPFPRLPLFALEAPGQFLVDDSAVDYLTLRADVQAHRALARWEKQFGLEKPLMPELGVYGDPNGGMQMMESGGPPSPPGVGEGSPIDPPVVAPAYSYPAHVLWLEITTVTNPLAHLIVHGTVAEAGYEILSREVLTNLPWASEGTVAGAAAQDWTPTTVAVGTRTNALFFWARLGLPAAWQWRFFGQLGVASAGDPDADGLTNLEEYLGGTSPLNAPEFAVWVAAPQRFSSLP